MRPERGFCFQVHVPAGETLYVVSAAGTAEVRAQAGDAIAVEELTFEPSPMRTRGAMTAAMRRGLFAESFGPSYYRGYVDSSPDLVSVDFSARAAPGLALHPSPRGLLTPPVMVAGGAAGLLAATSVSFAILARNAREDFERTTFERQAIEASGRYTRDRTIAFVVGAGAVVAAATTVWLIWHGRRADAALSVSTRAESPGATW